MERNSKLEIFKKNREIDIKKTWKENLKFVLNHDLGIMWWSGILWEFHITIIMTYDALPGIETCNTEIYHEWVRYAQ